MTCSRSQPLASPLHPAVFWRQVPCTAIANRYPFRLGCIADVGQTFNSSTTLQRLLVSRHPS